MPTKTIGIILLVVGLLMIAYTGFDFVTSKKVAEIGNIDINQHTNHFFQWSPILGIILAAVGIILLVFKKAR